MKTRLLNVPLLVMVVLSLRAQEYEPILKEGNEWSTLAVTVCGPQTPDRSMTFVNWLSGDTLVNGVSYTRVMKNVNGEGNSSLMALLREENGKVWRYQDGVHEVLLYDFTASVGDALFGDDSFVVDSISIEQIGGVDRRKLWFGLEYDFVGDPITVETWIEGIGSDLGLLCSGTYNVTGGYYRALCFHQNGELIWQNPEYDACIITTVEEIEDAGISIYPNPAKESMTIDGIGVSEVQVYNAIGQLVKTIQGTNEVNVSDMPEGVYVLHITDTEGVSYTERITVVR